MRQEERDAEWVLSCCEQRDERALEAVVKHYTGYVLTVIRKTAVPPLAEEDAEELASNVFVTFWKKASEIRDPFALKAWLAQTARREAIDRLRRKKEWLPLEEDVLLTTEKQPDNILVFKDQAIIIAETLGTMDTVRRACLIYRYYYADELPTIAKRLNIPLSTVKSHIYRGRRQLIATLQERGYSYEEQNNVSGII